MQEEKTAVRPGRARRLKRLRRWLIFVALFYLMPLAAAGWAYWLRGPRVHWSQADRSPVGLAPDSARTPEAVVQVPSTALGKNYPVDGVVSRTPSGTGWQASLGGLFTVAAGIEEGIEIDLVGLALGVDFKRPALRLPGLGRFGMN